MGKCWKVKRILGFLVAVLALAGGGLGSRAIDASRTKEVRREVGAAAETAGHLASDALAAQVSDLKEKAENASANPRLVFALQGNVDESTMRDLWKTEEWWRPWRTEFKIYAVAVSGLNLDVVEGIDAADLDAEALIRRVRERGDAASDIIVGKGLALRGGGDRRGGARSHSGAHPVAGQTTRPGRASQAVREDRGRDRADGWPHDPHGGGAASRADFAETDGRLGKWWTSFPASGRDVGRGVERGGSWTVDLDVCVGRRRRARIRGGGHRAESHVVDRCRIDCGHRACGGAAASPACDRDSIRRDLSAGWRTDYRLGRRVPGGWLTHHHHRSREGQQHSAVCRRGRHSNRARAIQWRYPRRGSVWPLHPPRSTGRRGHGGGLHRGDLWSRGIPPQVRDQTAAG